MSPAKQPGMRPANPRADRPFKPPGMSPANTVNDMAQNWTPSSWRNKPIQQVPDYPDAEALKVTEARLAKFPPLVFAGEARRLTSALADVAEGRGFLLQGGDCAESFRRARGRQHPRLLPRLPADGRCADLRRPAAGGQGWPHRRPVRQAALVQHREAGMASSCRATAATSSTASSSTRATASPIRNARSWPTGSRQPRSTCCAPLRQGGYANLDNVHQWMLGFVKDSPQAERYRKLADRISETMDFMKAIGITAKTTRACAKPISSPAMKRCCWATRRR
jgi:3-deoxy-7-phosphoheptulonate synthase